MAPSFSTALLKLAVPALVVRLIVPWLFHRPPTQLLEVTSPVTLSTSPAPMFTVAPPVPPTPTVPVVQLVVVPRSSTAPLKTLRVPAIVDVPLPTVSDRPPATLPPSI